MRSSALRERLKRLDRKFRELATPIATPTDSRVVAHFEKLTGMSQKALEWLHSEAGKLKMEEELGVDSIQRAHEELLSQIERHKRREQDWDCQEGYAAAAICGSKWPEIFDSVKRIVAEELAVAADSESASQEDDPTASVLPTTDRL